MEHARRRRTALAGVAALAIAALAACAPGMQVDKVPLAEAEWTGAATVLAPLRFEKATVGLRRGRRIGAYHDGLSCTDGGKNIWWNTGAVLAKDIDWNALFHEQATIAGHTVLGDPSALFERQTADRARPAYLVSARIEDIRLNLCEVTSLFTGDRLDAQTGEGSVRVYWQVLSVLEKKVVLEASTAGYFEVTRPVGDAPVLLIMEAFAQAAANFAADPGLITLVSAPRPTREVVVRARVGERRWLPAVPPFADGLLANIDSIRHSVVMVENGEGRAAGFFIAPDLILTTHGAVEGTELVRVRLTTGRTILGSVQRWHEPRGVALVQVERAGHQPLPLRLDPVDEAQDVYAIANPGVEGRRATVSRGVVSAHGQNAHGLPDILADVSFPDRMAGAPLLDASGAVVGVGQDGVRTSTFAPVAEALRALDLRRRHPNDTREEDAEPEPEEDAEEGEQTGGPAGEAAAL